MLITKTIRIDMGHRVPNHKSKCKNFHGHSYTIEVGVDDKVVTTEGASDEGMVIDFSDLKKVMLEEIDEKFDHGFCMWAGDEYQSEFHKLLNKGQKIIFVTFIPTAENLAQHWYMVIALKLRERGINLKYVKVWETPTSTATYREE